MCELCHQPSCWVKNSKECLKRQRRNIKDTTRGFTYSQREWLFQCAKATDLDYRHYFSIISSDHEHLHVHGDRDIVLNRVPDFPFRPPTILVDGQNYSINDDWSPALQLPQLVVTLLTSEQFLKVSGQFSANESGDC